MDDGVFGPISDATHVTFGPVEIDVREVGDARLKRMVFPAGMRWSTALQPLAGTTACEHAHVGYLVHGALRFEFPDGCVTTYAAPAFVDVPPGHDALVDGDEPAVLIEVDFLHNTVARLGIADSHGH